MSGTTVQAKPGCGPEVKLTFSPLQDVETFLHDEAHGGKRGVYMWGFCFPNPATGKRDPFIPYYVGKHRSSIRPYFDVYHVKGIMSGTHRLLKRELLLGPDCLKYFHHVTLVPEHCDYAYLHERDKKSKSDLLEPQKAALQLDIKAYMDNLFVAYLTTRGLDLKSDETEFIDALESYVQVKLGGRGGTERLVSRHTGSHPEGFAPEIKPGPGTEHLFPLK
jgi:hypothetical protein